MNWEERKEEIIEMTLQSYSTEKFIDLIIEQEKEMIREFAKEVINISKRYGKISWYDWKQILNEKIL